MRYLFLCNITCSTWVFNKGFAVGVHHAMNNGASNCQVPDTQPLLQLDS